jgi:hypothetical protein
VEWPESKPAGWRTGLAAEERGGLTGAGGSTAVQIEQQGATAVEQRRSRGHRLGGRGGVVSSGEGRGDEGGLTGRSERRSTRRRSVDRGLNDGLLFGDSWSCGLRTVLLEEEGGARAKRWPVAWVKQRQFLVGVGCSGGRGEQRGD